ncbi:Aminopeptidase N [Armadillidium nasatum]|uniref:Aminopeptidase N n=1 Tax=Armadillidium nasatum TaxID=96803 RepID=A0A5N5TIB0_9CRUS|nr:Aminopeptidase N [Armadillidium nasatum]
MRTWLDFTVHRMCRNKTIYLGATQMEATHARRVFPCFDEPALKATFNIHIARQEGYRVISNMPSRNSLPIENQDGWFWEVFNSTLPMSTYLIAFVVSDFEFNASVETSGSVPFNIWARQEAISQTEYAAYLGPKILKFYEEYFGITFPLPKQDMAALPDFKSGAMENWGLITYRETALLYDSLHSKALDKQRIGSTIAHELAHMWFGDLVSPKWWSELWLNEGFATYMEHIGLHSVEPSFKMLEQIVISELHTSFSTDVLDSSHPINVEVNDPEEIDQIFDAISYSKGASIIRMMNYSLTEITFRKGLYNYLNELSYSSATQDDLWYYLTLEAHKDGTLDLRVTVKEIMESWTLQKGFPVVTVWSDSRYSSVHITQEKFTLISAERKEIKSNQTWWIPLTFTTQSNPDFTQAHVKKWMSVGEKRTTLTGMLEYKIPLQIGQYLSQERELVPWLTALTNFEYLRIMFERTSTYGYLKDYITYVATPLYNSLGFKDSLEDPHDIQLLRSSLLSSLCRLGFEDCVSNAKKLFSEWMEAEDSSVQIWKTYWPEFVGECSS